MTNLTPNQLYRQLDWLANLRQMQGRGHTPEAAEICHYCRTMRRKVKAELRRRGLPGRRPDDTRVYGPGQTAWQGRTA